MVESPSLEVSEQRKDAALEDIVNGEHGWVDELEGLDGLESLKNLPALRIP